MLATIEMPSVRAYPPRVSAFTQPFWQGLADGRWTTTRCSACRHVTFPPKAVCPQCWSTDHEWIEIGARGSVYSWTRIHAAPTVFAAEAPYSVCIVDLDCGIRLACKLIDDAGSPPRIGMPVEIVRLHYEDGDLFAARPIAAQEA